MREEYDFSTAKRAKDVPHLAQLQAEGKSKTRITIMLDNEILNTFRAEAEQQGLGYQTLINQALREYIKHSSQSLESTLRKVIRDELQEFKNVG
ncbi:MAG: BrnA antitoxin family protein [bacterium]